MAGKRGVIITTSGERSIHEVANDLKAAGMDVDQVLESAGSITGSAEAHVTERLRRVAGVSDVSDDHPVDIGPPDAPVS